MEIQETRKNDVRKNVTDGIKNRGEIQASSQRFWTQQRYYLFSKRVNGCQLDGFTSMG